MSHLLALVTPWDPLHNDGYQFWSGIGSGSPLLAGVAIYVRRHNCHRKGCPFIAWHPNGTRHIMCRLHHEDHHGLLSKIFKRLGLDHGESGEE